MSLVDVKCPNCGASIQLDNSREFGFCSYCGSKVQIQEAVRKIEIDKSGDIQSYIELSKSSIEAGNGQEAYDYANKALELSTQNAEAWFLKMQALDLMASIDDLKCREIVTAGSKSLELDTSEDRKINVYRCYLEFCIGDLKYCITQLLNTNLIRDLYNSYYAVNPFTATKEVAAMDSVMLSIIAQAEQMIALRLAVPDSEVANNEELMNIAEQIAVQWIEFQKALNARLNVLGTHIDEQTLAKFQEILNRIKQGLPANRQVGITGEKMVNDGGGCYIATAVYGSYYAPEVLVLRHFRDETLRKYYFGRLFIRVYYLLSPPVAKRLRNAKIINMMVRSVLDKWVRYLSKI